MAEQQQEKIVDDRKVRQQIKKKDFEHIARMKKEMQIEDDELKQYFQQAKQPVKEDPSVKRNSPNHLGQDLYNQKIQTFSQALKGFHVFNVIGSFWRFQPATPQQTETLRVCKRHVLYNLGASSLAGLAITSLTSYYYRVYFGYPMMAFGVFVGVVGGGMFGLIRSTQFVLEKLDKLGPEYALGRLVHQEIEDYRMDKKKIPV